MPLSLFSPGILQTGAMQMVEEGDNHRDGGRGFSNSNSTDGDRSWARVVQGAPCRPSWTTQDF